MITVSVRKAAPGEGPALSALQLRASSTDPAFAEVLRNVPEAIAVDEAWIAAGRVLVADHEGCTIGFAVVLDRDEGVELEGLFVEPAAWRRGAGRALVAEAAALARAEGAPVLHVIGNPNARAFYEACGFELTDTRQMQFGTGLVMKLRL